MLETSNNAFYECTNLTMVEIGGVNYILVILLLLIA